MVHSEGISSGNKVARIDKGVIWDKTEGDGAGNSEGMGCSVGLRRCTGVVGNGQPYSHRRHCGWFWRLGVNVDISRSRMEGRGRGQGNMEHHDMVWYYHWIFLGSG